MVLFRALCYLLVAAVLAAGLFGAGLASVAHAHGPDEVRSEQGLSVVTAGAMNECCQNTSDRGASCTSVMGVAPDAPELSPSLGFATTIAFRPIDLSDGREPHDLLDPPRTA